ncbi:hypothetical protein B7486_63380, partial [cyanobacterium TDX16]
MADDTPDDPTPDAPTPDDPTPDEAGSSTSTRAGSRRRRAPVVTAVAGLVVGLALVGTGMASEDDPVADPAETMERAPLPTGSQVEGRTGAETSAERLVAALDAVARADGETCDPEDLVVRWTEPAEEPEHGAWVEPLGAPEEGDDQANGIVGCRGSDHEVAGFQAQYDDGRWSVGLVPDLGHDDAELASPEQHAGDQEEQAAAADHEADEALEDEQAAEGADGDTVDPPLAELLDGVPAPGATPVLPGVGEDPNVFAADSPWVGLWDEIA